MNEQPERQFRRWVSSHPGTETRKSFRWTRANEGCLLVSKVVKFKYTDSKNIGIAPSNMQYVHVWAFKLLLLLKVMQIYKIQWHDLSVVSDSYSPWCGMVLLNCIALYRQVLFFLFFFNSLEIQPAAQYLTILRDGCTTLSGLTFKSGYYMNLVTRHS